jgi:phosphoribosylanthranilate isomerase
MTTRVKICGLTRAEDAELAIALGASYVGFVYVRESPRFVERAPKTEGAVRVGVFRGAAVEEIAEIAERDALDFVQVHDVGQASACPEPSSGSDDELDRLKPVLHLPIIRALHVRDVLPDTATDADYLLFDTGGGTGRTFDWSLLAGLRTDKPFFLAGGITPDNVAEAIRIARPFAIDVSSGVESSPGVKDPDKLKAFFARIPR